MGRRLCRSGVTSLFPRPPEEALGLEGLGESAARCPAEHWVGSPPAARAGEPLSETGPRHSFLP